MIVSEFGRPTPGTGVGVRLDGCATVATFTMHRGLSPGENTSDALDEPWHGGLPWMHHGFAVGAFSEQAGPPVVGFVPDQQSTRWGRRTARWTLTERTRVHVHV